MEMETQRKSNYLLNAGEPEIPYTEYDALQAIYNSTNGNEWHWRNLTSEFVLSNDSSIIYKFLNYSANSVPWKFTTYKQDRPCSDHWQGIICSCNVTNCSIVQLDLGSHNLNGTLPNIFTQLPNLIAIQVSVNHLENPIPNSIGLLPGLQYLGLGSNRFRGTVPEFIGNMSNLLVLNLNNNFFANEIDFSWPFSKVSNLLSLDLSNNFFTGSLPSSVCTVGPKLRALFVSNNFFAGQLPNCFSNLNSIEAADFSLNYFDGSFPSFIFQWPNLSSIDLSFNYFVDYFPANITSIPNLKDLNLESNNFYGTLPNSIGDIQKLLKFSVSINHLVGTLPDSFSKLTNLRVLSIGDNSFHGTLSSVNFPLDAAYLQILNIRNNFFVAENNATYLLNTAFNRLLFLNIQQNLFSGLLPMNRAWVDITGYIVGDNYFTQHIPDCIETYTNLRILSVQSNYLSGTLSPNLFQSVDTILNTNFSSNCFTGTIPSEVGNLSYLNQFSVDHNQLTGTIPASISQLTQLVVLSVSYNSLTGTVTGSLLSNAPVQKLFMQNNKLQGNIGNLMENLKPTYLTNLDLSENLFTGSLSSLNPSNNQSTILSVLSNLQTFSLSVNCLSGTIPDWFCSLESLRILSLDGLSTAENCRNYFFPSMKQTIGTFTTLRTFQQTIPACYFQMNRLSLLHLSGNGLTGTLPDTLAILSNFTDLSLSHNSLTGTIPISFQQKIWENLDLSYNKLTGTLSDEFVQPAETTITLEVNRLSGPIPSGILDLESISILNGNMFGCESKNDLPSNDREIANYNCGSNATNEAISAWVGFYFGLLLILLIFFPLRDRIRNFFKARTLDAHHAPADENKREIEASRSSNENTNRNSIFEEMYRSLVTSGHRIQQWRNSLKDLPKQSNIFFLSLYFEKIRELFSTLTLYSIIILLPVYATLTLYYSAVSYSYIWSVSGVLVSGNISVAVMILLFVLLIIWLYRLLRLMISLRERHTIHHQGRFSTILSLTKVQFSQIVVYGFVGLVDFVIMGSMDVAYVFVVLNASSQIMITTAFGLAVVRIVVNNTLLWDVLPYGHYLLQSKIKKREDTSAAEKKDIELNEIVKEKSSEVHNPLANSVEVPDSELSNPVAVGPSDGLDPITTDESNDHIRRRSSIFGMTKQLLNFNNMIRESVMEQRPTMRKRANTDELAELYTHPSIVASPTSSVDPLPSEQAENPAQSTPVPSNTSASSALTASRFLLLYSFTTADVSFLQAMILCNNIILPVIAIFFVSPDCFYNVLFLAPEVTSSYSYTSCSGYLGTDHRGGVLCQVEREGTSYTPPFSYRYDCSSAIVINYVTVYIWMFVFVGAVMPLITMILKLVYDVLRPRFEDLQARQQLPQESTSSSVSSFFPGKATFSERCLILCFQLVNQILRESLKELKPSNETVNYQFSFTGITPITRSDSSSSQQTLTSSSLPLSRRRSLFKKLKFGLNINSYLTILLSFGVLFPPLMILGCLSVLFLIVFEEILIGRVLFEAKKKGYDWYEGVLERECDGVADVLIVSYPWMIAVACFLYGYILFDAWGDVNGWKTALIPSLLIGVGIPLGIYCLERYLHFRKRNYHKNRLMEIDEIFESQLAERDELAKRISARITETDVEQNQQL